MSWKDRILGNLKGDLFGGLTAGIVALPLALGFGVASGIEGGALAGMYGAIVVGLFAAIFGGTPSQISGPTGPMTVLVAGIVAAMTGDPAWVFVMIALAGVFQIALGVLRVGRYVNYIPYPVISGFMSGIGVIIIVFQVAQLLGHPPEKEGVLAAFEHIPGQIADTNLAALLLGLGTVALIYATPRVTKAVPGSLVGLVVMTVVAVVSGADVPAIGEIPTELPELRVPEWEWTSARMILMPAFVLAVVGSLDSLLTSLVADAVTKTKHSSTRELIGQGIGNMLSGLVGGLPGAGATVRTVVNVRSGGRTRLSGVVHALFLLLVLAVLAPLAARIPMTVLAGILITVGIGIIDVKGLKHVHKIARGDAFVMGLTLFLTVFVDLMWAVGAGMVAASLILMKRLADMDPATHSPLEDIATHRAWIPELEDHPEEVRKGIFVVEFHGSLFFGNAGPLQDQVSRIEGARALVLHLGDVRYVDASGVYALRDMIEEHQGRGTTIYLCELHEEPRDMLRALSLAPGLVPAEHVFEHAADAVKAATAAIGSATTEPELEPLPDPEPEAESEPEVDPESDDPAS